MQTKLLWLVCSTLTLSALTSGCVRLSPRPLDDSGVVEDSDTDSDSDSQVDTNIDPTLRPLAEHVIIMVMDGARLDETFGDGYSEASASLTADLFQPVKERLGPIGTIIKPGYNTGITITGPGHCNLLTGARQEFGHFATPAGAGMYRPELPTLYEAFRDQFGSPEAQMVLTGNTDHVESLAYSLYPGFGSADQANYRLVSDPSDPNDTEPAANDVQVVDAVQSRLEIDQPRLLLANLHAMDRAGHYNSDPMAYGQRVEQMAQPLVDLWDWIQSDQSGEMKDSTVLVIVADHGRHRWGDEAEERLGGSDGPDFRNHGDQCRGCREIPVIMVGPGIKQGVTITAPYTQEDISVTVARLLGVALPYGSGMVIEEALEGEPAVAQRSGAIAPALAPTFSAASVYANDDGVQSILQVDGVPFSSAEAIHAEAPVAFSDGSRDVVCWRELTLMIGSDELDWPWFGECRTRVDGGDWLALALPDKVVSSVWRPALAEDSAGKLMLAFADNTNSSTYWNSLLPASIKLWRWSDASGWEGTSDSGPATDSIFPGNPSLTRIGETWFVAYANSDLGASHSTNPGRYTRHVSVQQVTWGDRQSWSEIWRNVTSACDPTVGCPNFTPTADTEGNEYGRYEHPQIASIENTLYVGYLAYSEAGNTILLSTGTGKGASWDTPQRVDTTGRVLGHIPPLWVNGALYWARISSSDSVEVCKLIPGDVADCVDTGSPRIMGLSGAVVAGETAIVASLDGGVAEWEVSPVVW